VGGETGQNGGGLVYFAASKKVTSVVLRMTKEQDLFTHPAEGSADRENPGWKPLIWLAGIIVLAIIMGEVLVVFGLELLELLGEAIFYVVEGSEEFLEDAVEHQFNLDPWEAERYTAWTTMPFKVLLGLWMLRAAWRWNKRKGLPAIQRWLQRQWSLIRASWRGVWWPWKTLIVVVVAGVLVILI
jgi:hypothetical protein